MKVEVGGNDTCSLKSPVSYSLYPDLPDIRELNYLFQEVFSTQRVFFMASILLLIPSWFEHGYH